MEHLIAERQQARKEIIEEIKKELDRWVGICACDEAYKIRDLIDPSCDYHKYEGFFDWLDTLK
jgi:hypothetical protein